MRLMTLASSTDVPSQRLDGQSRWSEILRARPGRFVSSWYVCRGVSAMTVKTSRMNDRGTPGWKRSPMELTKTIPGRRQW